MTYDPSTRSGSFPRPHAAANQEIVSGVPRYKMRHPLSFSRGTVARNIAPCRRTRVRMASALKKCPMCEKLHPVEQFSLRRSGTSRVQSYCKACAREYYRKYYASTRDEHNARRYRNQVKYRERNRELVVAYLKEIVTGAGPQGNLHGAEESASYRDVAQLGRASRLGREGRTFKSCHPD